MNKIFLNFKSIYKIEIIEPKESNINYKYFENDRLIEIKRKFLFIPLPSRWVKLDPGYYIESEYINDYEEEPIFDCTTFGFLKKLSFDNFFIENNKLYDIGRIIYYSINQNYSDSIRLKSLNSPLLDELKIIISNYPDIKMINNSNI